MDNSLSESEKIPLPLQHLRDALWGQPEDDLSHAECRAALPEFVEAEVAGEPVARLYPRVKQHLDHCDECGEEYALLLDLALAEANGELDFSSQTKRALTDVVSDLTRALLPALAPAHLHELGVIADTFFARVQQLGSFELRLGAAQAMGLGQRDTNPALNILAASYAATQSLAREITRAQFNEWTRQNTLQRELETRADASARSIGLERDLAARFARAYAEQIVQNPETLRAQLHDV